MARQPPTMPGRQKDSGWKDCGDGRRNVGGMCGPARVSRGSCACVSDLSHQ